MCVNNCTCGGFNLTDEIPAPVTIINIVVNGDNTLTITLSNGDTIITESPIEVPPYEYNAFAKASGYDGTGCIITETIDPDDWAITEASVPANFTLEWMGKYAAADGDLLIKFGATTIATIPSDLFMENNYRVRGSVKGIRANTSGVANFDIEIQISIDADNAPYTTLVFDAFSIQDLTASSYDLDIRPTTPSLASELLGYTLNVITRKPA